MSNPRESVSSRVSRRQSVSYIEQVSFRPFCVTCYDHYVAAYLCSTSRGNYLALWGPEEHMSVTGDLDVTSAKFCKNLCNGTVIALCLRVLRVHGSIRLIFYATSREYIERWELNEFGDVLTYNSVRLQTGIETFIVSRNGDSIISFESNFIVLRNSGLRVYGMYKLGKEVACDGVLIDHNDKRYLIACYESGLVVGWEVLDDEDEDLQPMPVFELHLLTRDALCAVVEVKNDETLYNRRLCVASRDGHVWLLEWSMKNLSVCNEVRRVDLRKKLRYKTGKSGTDPSGQHDGVGVSGGGLVVQTMATAPDVGGGYIPLGCRASSEEKYPQDALYKPVLCVVTSTGGTVVIDVENFKVVLSLSARDQRNELSDLFHGAPVVSSCITSVFLGDNERQQAAFPDNYSDDSSEGSVDRAEVAARAAAILRRGSVTDSSNRRSSNARRRSSVMQTDAKKLRSQLFAVEAARMRPSSEEYVLITLSVILSGFDRKITLRPTYIKRINSKANNRNNYVPCTGDKRETEQKEHVRFASRDSRPPASEQQQQAEKEVRRLPRWAQTDSADSLLEDGVGSLHLATEECKDNDSLQDQPLSFFTPPPACLPEKSPLHALSPTPSGLPTTGKYQDSARSSVSRARSTGGRGDWEKPGKTKTGELVDLPVTFHCRVKSSGYGSADVASNRWKQRRQPNMKRRSLSASRAANKDRTTDGARLRMYPKDCSLLTVRQEHNDYPPRVSSIQMTPIMRMSFSADGSNIGIVSAGNDVGTLKTPLGRYKGEGLFYLGHDGQVNTVEFSHSSNLLISSSADHTARIWRMGKVDSAAVVLSHKHNNPKVGGPGPSPHKPPRPLSQTRNKPFAGPISSASFFYMDKFALLSSRASVYMYSYDLGELDAANDLKRLQAVGKYKLVNEWSCGAAQSITAMACMNSVCSTMILAAGSDRSICILDAVTGQTARTVESAHERPINWIALPQPSVHVPLPQHAFNVFATSASDNLIVLWDVRSPRCVARYADHINRREKIQCAFSPCMRYLATGSEDRSARILDVTSGREVAKLSGAHRDVVSGVSFHPIHPQLATCSYDGAIRCYTSE